jgi:alkylation response protein AidB-like acyl-CoA dehydrogenase
MESPGVSTAPITLISGNSPFCQTFFEDVLVPKANLVGQLNKGWEVAKLLLAHERDMIGGSGLSTGETRSLRQIATEAIGLSTAFSPIRISVFRSRYSRWTRRLFA